MQKCTTSNKPLLRSRREGKNTYPGADTRQDANTKKTKGVVSVLHLRCVHVTPRCMPSRTSSIKLFPGSLTACKVIFPGADIRHDANPTTTEAMGRASSRERVQIHMAADPFKKIIYQHGLQVLPPRQPRTSCLPHHYSAHPTILVTEEMPGACMTP